MSGSKSRRKGIVAEQQAVLALKRSGYEALTSRAARDGTQRGADIICPDLPVALEVKNGSRDELPGWLDQARAQADTSAPGAVLHKRRGMREAEDWFLTMQFDDFLMLLEQLRNPNLSEVPF